MKLFLLVWHSDWPWHVLLDVLWNEPRQRLDDSVRLGWALSPAPACAGSSALSEMALWIMNSSVSGPRMRVWSELGVSACLWHLALCVCSGNFSPRWGETKGERREIYPSGRRDEREEISDWLLMSQRMGWAHAWRKKSDRERETEREVREREMRRSEGEKRVMWSKPTLSHFVWICTILFVRFSLILFHTSTKFIEITTETVFS